MVITHPYAKLHGKYPMLNRVNSNYVFLKTSFTFSFSPRRPGGDVSGSFPGFPPFPFEEAGNFGASARIRLERRECLRIQTTFQAPYAEAFNKKTSYCYFLVFKSILLEKCQNKRV